MHRRFSVKWAAGALLFSSLGLRSKAQTPAPAPSQPAPTAPAASTPAGTTPADETDPGTSPAPRGQVLIQSHGEPPPPSSLPGIPSDLPGNAQRAADQPVVDETAKADLTDEQRAAMLITAYDLDAHLDLPHAGLSVRAQITVRNDGSAPLRQLALQLSSTLRWESATLVNAGTRTPLALSQHPLDTDADHTGAETEAILPLPAPLAPGSSATLDVFYSGTIPASAGRLQRLGANGAQQQSADWDAISSAWTGLRGFGNVLWYPVTSPQLFFAEGNSLFEAIGRARLRGESAPVHLRLSVIYAGDPPVAAYFCGRRQALTAAPDDPNAPTSSGSGVAVADFPTQFLGFRTPNLFLLQTAETFPATREDKLSNTAADAEPAASSSSSSVPDPPESSSGAVVPRVPPPATPLRAAQLSPDPGGVPVLALETMDTGTGAELAAATERVAPLLREWMGTRPLSALTVIDHAGQPFGDGPLLVAPAAALGTAPASQALIESLTHAWVQTGQPWMDEGLGGFFSLLWTEREAGREAALTALHDLVQPVALAEPETLTGPETSAGPGAATGQPLIVAADELFYRRKAAAVWWMLRDLAGEGNLHAALSAWRTQPASSAPPLAQAVAFEHLLEKLSGKDLGWFFADWVLRDRGLPDLSITDVAVAAERAGSGHPEGWVVAVTVRNEGNAVADVPLIVHSGNQRVESRMRIAGLSSVTQRVLIETSPTSVTVNDRGVPEIGQATHSRELNVKTQ